MNTDWGKQKQGVAWASQSGASDSDSLASELTDSPVSESLTRSAIGPAEAAKPPMVDSGLLRTDVTEGAKMPGARLSPLDFLYGYPIRYPFRASPVPNLRLLQLAPALMLDCGKKML
jgi:hypothetical protein